MPINIPSDLPAFDTLAKENIFVMSKERALKQDIRPLRAAIVNLMPTKIETETQLLRLLSNTALQIDITLIKTATHKSKNTSKQHLDTFYTTFDEVKGEFFDMLFITGAPVELMPFEEVTYWDELCKIMNWSKTHAWTTVHICWGAQAGLYYHYNINKHTLDKKIFGIFPQKCLVENHPLLKGFDELFFVPHSRHTEVRTEDILNNDNLIILAASDISGAHLITDKSGRQIFITGHAEYDRNTLKTEYLRDIEKGLPIDVPYNYFPDDDPKNEPIYTWRGHASLMYSNLINFCVYQETPYDLSELINMSL